MAFLFPKEKKIQHCLAEIGDKFTFANISGRTKRVHNI